VHAISPGPPATRAASGIPEFDAPLEKAKKKAPARSLVSIDDVFVKPASKTPIVLAGPADKERANGVISMRVKNQSPEDLIFMAQ
jgi:hypothetical protein